MPPRRRTVGPRSAPRSPRWSSSAPQLGHGERSADYGGTRLKLRVAKRDGAISVVQQVERARPSDVARDQARREDAVRGNERHPVRPRAPRDVEDLEQRLVVVQHNEPAAQGKPLEQMGTRGDTM